VLGKQSADLRELHPHKGDFLTDNTMPFYKLPNRSVCQSDPFRLIYEFSAFSASCP
jgi:hypothetical protein